MRAVLYRATVTAVRRNPLLKALHDRLKRAGKSHQVVMTACVHKLLRICNAVLSHHTSWRYQLRARHGEVLQTEDISMPTADRPGLSQATRPTGARAVRRKRGPMVAAGSRALARPAPSSRKATSG